MAENYSSVKTILRQILTKSLLPQVVLVLLILSVHWLIISLWFYFNYETTRKIQLIIITLVGGSLPFYAYGVLDDL